MQDYCYSDYSNSSRCLVSALELDYLQNPPPSPSPSHRPYPRNQVVINVYEVAGFGRMNRLMASQEAPIGGAMHAGVEVYGHEWSYGGGAGRGSGVICEPPRMNKQHRFRETVVMPPTDMTYSEVAEIVGDLLDLWPAEQYHWLRRNCLTFANELCERLGVGRMPAWIDRLARGAGAVDQGVSMVADQMAGVAEGARFIMSLVYGAGVCGQCTKSSASVSLNVVEAFSATKQPSRAAEHLARREHYAPDRLLETSAFAPRPQASQSGNGDESLGGASVSCPPSDDGWSPDGSPAHARHPISEPAADAEAQLTEGGCWEGTAWSAAVPSEARAPRPAATLRSRPDEATLSRHRVPPVPMIGMSVNSPRALPMSGSERAFSYAVPPNSCSAQHRHLAGRTAAPPSLRRDGPEASSAPPVPPRARR